jgi:DNA-binding HxlR family transcriptional regulator
MNTTQCRVHTKMFVMTKIKETSTNNRNRQVLSACNLTYTLNMLGGRWKFLILAQLDQGKLRYSEIKRGVPPITERMLTLQLREMEKDRLLIRTVHPEIPPRVEYELSEIAKSLSPIWKNLHEWGARHRALKAKL